MATTALAAVPDVASVQSAIQAAIDSTTNKVVGMSAADAAAAFRVAIQGAIAKSGARPKVVRAALAKISCPTNCGVALADVEVLVGQLAQAETRNESVAALGSSPLSSTGFTSSSFSSTPTASSGSSGIGSGYTTP